MTPDLISRLESAPKRNRHITASTKVSGKRRWVSVEAAKRRVKDGEMYFISRHNAWFRPGAHGYTNELAAAGIFPAQTARNYLDVEGLSVVPVKKMIVDIDAQIEMHRGAAARLESLRQGFAPDKGMEP